MDIPSDWTVRDNRLTRTFAFDNFVQAFAFCTQIALLAEKEQHHPKLTLTYQQVELELTTHDANDQVTELDRSFASAVNRLFN